MIKEFVCINCPLGCRITVTYKNAQIQTIAGNTCPRGISYAEQEFLNPLRVLTTLIRVEGTDRPLPVRSDKPVPLQLVFACKEYLNFIEAAAPIHCGDILVTNICNTGSNIVATADFDL